MKRIQKSSVNDFYCSIDGFKYETIGIAKEEQATISRMHANENNKHAARRSIWEKDCTGRTANEQKDVAKKFIIVSERFVNIMKRRTVNMDLLMV